MGPGGSGSFDASSRRLLRMATRAKTAVKSTSFAGKDSMRSKSRTLARGDMTVEVSVLRGPSFAFVPLIDKRSRSNQMGAVLDRAVSCTRQKSDSPAHLSNHPHFERRLRTLDFMTSARIRSRMKQVWRLGGTCGTASWFLGRTEVPLNVSA